MLVMKILAVVFALLVLVKMIMLLVAREYWMGLVDKMFKPGNKTGLVYGVATGLVGLPVLLQVSIFEIGAVMLWTSLLIGLGMVPYSEMVMKWRDEIAREGLGRIWWVLAIWVGLAVWILAAVFGG